jgi:hypothetical protein
VDYDAVIAREDYYGSAAEIRVGFSGYSGDSYKQRFKYAQTSNRLCDVIPVSLSFICGGLVKRRNI